jgi:DNA end-binding protein Ku
MAPRAYWTGNLKISLVTFGVRLYNAVSEAERIRLNQVHKTCNSRIKMPTTCPIHGQVDRSEIAKAYEFEKDRYVIIEQEELDKIKLRSEKTIELSKFVPIDSVDDTYFDGTYFLAPDGPVSVEPYRVIRQALEETGTAGIGRVTLSGREHPLLLRPHGPGFVLTTLHTAVEVRQSAPYFEEITNGAINQDYLKLATSLIKDKTGEFEPAEFHDRYQDALVELVKSKVQGQPPVIIREEEIPVTFNFLDALQKSVAAEESPKAEKGKKSAKKPPAKSEPAAETKVRKRKQA